MIRYPRHPLLLDLLAYADGELPPLPALAIVVHLGKCGRCRLSLLRMLERSERFEDCLPGDGDWVDH